MGIKLSHSAAEKYLTCPAQYRLHYIDKIRSTKLGSALLFGSALDEALNRLLESKLDVPTETSTDDIDRLKAGFDHYMTYQMVGKEQEDIRTSHYIEYYGSDFEAEILTEVELKSLSSFIQNAGYEQKDPIALYKEISTNIKAKREIDSTDQIFYNYASWLSLKVKGHMMLEHFIAEILPKITRVTAVQRAVELPNENGDILRGFIDFEGELEGHKGVFTIDNKTSGKNYKTSDINDKGQLLIYDEFTGHGQAAYIVLIKKIAYHKVQTCQKCGVATEKRVKKCAEGGTGKNRCNGELDLVSTPYIKHQILTDKIDEEKKDVHFEMLNGILEDIEAGEFPQNLDNCFQFGKPCIYSNLKKDGCKLCPSSDITGLVKK